MNDWAETAEQQLLDQALKLAPAEGWTDRMARLAGKACGFSPGETELVIPHGAADLAALLWRRHDRRALEILAETDPAALKIRERIRAGCEARIDACAQDESASRRCAAWLSLPPNLPLAGRLAWESADVLWRWAGDTATDENHYSKRALLAGILTGAGALQMTSGRGSALRFVDRRIADIMTFEKWKATNGFRPGDWLAGLARKAGEARFGRPVE